MSNFIFINIPNDIGYEKLSNNHKENIDIEGKIYPTITNYILSNLVNTSINKIILQNSDIKGNKKDINVDSVIKETIYNREKQLSRNLTKEEDDIIKYNINNDIEQKKLSIYEMLEILLKKEEEDIIYNAIEEAYTHILNTNKKSLEILLNTESSELYYKSENTFLGVNSTNQGSNIIGKILMQLRHNFKKKIDDKTIEKRIYDIYISLKYLEYRISIGLDIKKFIGRDISYILNYIIKLYADNNPIKNLITDKNIVIEMYNNNNEYFPLIKKVILNPTTSLAMEVRERDIKKLYINVLNKRKDIVFEEYINYYKDINKVLHENKGEKEELKDIVQSMISDNFNLYNSKKEQLYTLFENNKINNISEELNNIIKKKLSKYPIRKEYLQNKSSSVSSSSSISNSVSINNDSITENKRDSLDLDVIFGNKYKEKNKYSKKTNNILYITNNFNNVTDPLSYYLSPMSNINFSMNNYKYLNVLTYSMAILILKNTHFKRENIDISDIHNKISYKKGTNIDHIYNKYIYNNQYNQYFDLNYINNMYNQRKIDTLNVLKHEYLKKGLKIKFKNQDMKDLLIITDYKEIIYVDNKDLYLGFDNVKNIGLNHIGHEMMNIRQTIIQNMDKKFNIYMKKIISDDNVNLLFNEDFIKSWMSSRLGDFCKTIKKFNIYMKNIADIEEPLNVLFIKNVIELLYKPYNIKKEIYGIIQKETPYFFVGIVRECFGNYLENSTINIDEVEIDEIKNQLLNRYDNYRVNNDEKKIEMKEEHEKKIKLYKDIVKTLFLNKKDKSIEYNLNNFKNIFESLINDIEKTYTDSKSIEEKQRDEIKLAKDVIYAPVLNEEEIKKQLSDLINKQQIELKEMKEDKYKIKQLKEIHNREKNELMFKLYKPKKNIKEIYKEVEELNEKHLKEYNEYIKYFDDKITIQQLVIDDQKVEKLNTQLNKLTNKRKEKILLEINNIDSNGLFLWKYMTSILSTLLYKLSKKNKNGVVDMIDIKKIIINSQYDSVSLNSLKCAKIINGDDYSNCIVSAIVNILISIENFKKEYMEDIIFSIYDVDLAISILLNEDIISTSKKENKNPNIDDVDDNEDVDDILLTDEVKNQIEYDDDSEYNDSNYGSDNTDGDSDVKDDEDSNYGSDNGKDSGADMDFKFNMKDKEIINTNLNLINLKQKLIEINQILNNKNSNDENLTTISNYILNKIEYIKKYNNIDIKLKINRINFFSTKINNL